VLASLGNTEPASPEGKAAVIDEYLRLLSTQAQSWGDESRVAGAILELNDCTNKQHPVGRIGGQIFVIRSKRFFVGIFIPRRTNIRRVAANPDRVTLKVFEI
jgi:hypothetical protein